MFGSGQPGLVVGDTAPSRGLKADDPSGPFQPRPLYDSMNPGGTLSSPSLTAKGNIPHYPAPRDRKPPKIASALFGAEQKDTTCPEPNYFFCPEHTSLRSQHKILIYPNDPNINPHSPLSRKSACTFYLTNTPLRASVSPHLTVRSNFSTHTSTRSPTPTRCAAALPWGRLCGSRTSRTSPPRPAQRDARGADPSPHGSPGSPGTE